MTHNINLAKQKINIVEIVQQSGVQIKKQGKDYFSVCPFHSEKTASFSVSPVKQIFHCFGCGSGGDVIEFVKKYHNLDFPGALQFLGINQTTPENKHTIRRASQARRQEKKRKQYQDKLYDKFSSWRDSYLLELVEWVEILDKALLRMSWEQLKELDGLVKIRSVWGYHIWLIATVGDEDLIYELYLDKNGG